MAKHVLNTYLEPWQKARLERIAAQRKVSQATIVREAIEEYVGRHDPDARPEPAQQLWERVLDGVYDGDGSANHHDDIYADVEPTARPRRAKPRARRAKR
jgi:predicted DNA-binding protein